MSVKLVITAVAEVNEELLVSTIKYCRKLENYQESSWSSMSELERELKQLEMNVAEQFGEAESDEYLSEEEAATDVNTGGDHDEALQDDFVAAYADSLYCIACKKSFKSEKA